MAETSLPTNEEPVLRPQSSIAETAFDREIVAQSRKEDTNNPEEVIYIPESTESPIQPPSFEVKEAYVKDELDNVNPREKPVIGIFSKLAGTVQNIFRWRKIPIKTARITPDSCSNFLDAERAEVTRDQSRTTNARANTIRMNQLGSKSEENHSQMQFTNNHSFQLNLLVNHLDKNEPSSAFESKIYSVNSAGKPIPLTIENDKNDDTSEESSSGK